MRPTREQQAAIESGSPRLVVHAFAGAGKTSMMVARANAYPSRRMIYIAFSKAIQLEARKKFPKNVDCVTSHGVAFQQYGSLYGHKIVPTLRINQVASALGLDDYPDELRLHLADACLKTLARFLNSTAEMIGPELVRGVPGTLDSQVIVDLTERLWQRMCDPRDLEVGMLNDGYLKLYALSAPRLDYDELLFDEAQDTNPVTAAIIESQSCNKILVGDEHQSIFAFRGATNAMRQFQADQTLRLTQSFRFGQEIADVANFLLSTYKQEPCRIIGSAERGRVGPLPPGEPYAVIARTNGKVFAEAITALNEGKKVFFVGGIDGYRISDMLDAHRLLASDTGNVKNPYLRSFGNFDKLAAFADSTDDKELRSLVRVVQRYGAKIPALVSGVRRNTVDRPEAAMVHLATAHKSKGLEWNNVRLTDDYVTLLDKNDKPRHIPPSEHEDINILYVAQTRARKVVQLFPALQQLIDKQKTDQRKAPPAVNERPLWARPVVTRP